MCAIFCLFGIPVYGMRRMCHLNISYKVSCPEKPTQLRCCNTWVKITMHAIGDLFFLYFYKFNLKRSKKACEIFLISKLLARSLLNGHLVHQGNFTFKSNINELSIGLMEFNKQAFRK